ncbi:MAG: hypothetical protein LBB45_05220 [Methanobrevibacter sp.]|nr:hypothetical protein [Candidatus Methanovirga basalitermitum]
MIDKEGFFIEYNHHIEGFLETSNQNEAYYNIGLNPETDQLYVDRWANGLFLRVDEGLTEFANETLDEVLENIERSV